MVLIPSIFVSIQTLAVAKVVIFCKMYQYTSMSIDIGPWSIDTGLKVLKVEIIYALSIVTSIPVSILIRYSCIKFALSIDTK